ncbi:MAG: iron-containing redox enzyme family protein [Pseudomonadales bacterium]
MAFYDDLLVATEYDKQYLLSAPIINDVFEGRFTLETYIAFLNQAYHHVRHTVPLLSNAADNLRPHQAWIRSTLLEYIDEEAGHEAWILDDLAACGCDRKVYEQADAPLTSDVMVAYLYDYVARKNPLGIFGMVLVLEGTSSNLAPVVADIVQEKLALADAAMTYLRTHGELDQHHINYFERAMNQVEDAADQAAIINVERVIYQLYGDVYRAIPAAAEDIARRAA